MKQIHPILLQVCYNFVADYIILFFIKRDLSQELHKELLQEFDLEKIEFITIPSKLIKEDIGWSTSVTKKEQKLVRTLPGITFIHEIHQEYFAKK